MSAQTVSLSLWPPLLEVQMIPGKSVTQAYQLSNNSDFWTEITPMIFPFTASGENGGIDIDTNVTAQNDPSPYFFSFDSGEELGKPFFLKPNEAKQVVLKISLPKNTDEKDYYFTLLFSTVTRENQKEKSNTDSVTQIGANILLTASAEENPAVAGRIVEFSAPKIVDSFSRTDFNVVLENFGGTFWKPFGKIQIEGILKQKGEIKLLEQNILANSKRKLETDSYKPKLPFGPFKAKLTFSLNSEDTENKLTSEITFWYLPYKLMIAVGTLGIILIVSKKIKRHRV